MLTQHTFGTWLRLKRKSLDQTRDDLAGLVGCSPETIRKLESEERRPSAQIAERLAVVLGIPESERRSFLAFARGDWKSAPDASVADIPWKPRTASIPANIPAAATSLVGREDEIAEVRARLREETVRLVNLIGPPGIGKTRLSLAVSQSAQNDFPDGVFFVPLAPLDNPAFVEPAVLQALGYVESRNLPVRQQLTGGIGQQQVLLVLDNCEPFTDLIAALVSDLLSDCPRMKILVTSREALRVPGEWLYRVPALEIPGKPLQGDLAAAAQFPALTLFAERARAVRPDFKLDEGNIAAVASICARLDGLPLAIELLAPQMRVMSPQALLERMTGRYLLSADGVRSVPVRQKSLENAIGWSYDQLSAQEQKSLTCLAVFHNGFSLQAAEQVLAETAAAKPVPALIASLADKSLLQHNLLPDGEVRLHMLQTIQTFALDRLHAAGDEAWARDLHLETFLQLAEQGEREIRGPSQVEWIHKIDLERDNFRAALEWSAASQNTGAALRLLSALGWPWEVRGYYREARSWLDRIRLLPEMDQHPVEAARLLNHIGRHSLTQARYQDANALLEESRSIAERLGADGETILVETLNWLGLNLIFWQKNADSAASLFQQGLVLSEKRGDQQGIALSTFHLGIAESYRDNLTLSLELMEKSFGLFQQFQDWFYVARTASFLGSILLEQDRYDEALRYFMLHLQIDQEILFWDGIADALRDLGRYHLSTGSQEQAALYYDQCYLTCREHGLIIIDACHACAILALGMGRYDLAKERFIELLESAHQAGDSAREITALMGLAAVAAEAKQPERSARLSGAAQAVLESCGQPQLDLAHFDPYIQAAIQQVGEQVFASLQAEGRAMTSERVIRYASG